MKKKSTKKKNIKKLLLIIIPTVLVIAILTIFIIYIVRESTVNNGERKGTIKGNTIVYRALGETTWCSRTCEVKNSSIAKIEYKLNNNDVTDTYKITPLKTGETVVNCYIKCCDLNKKCETSEKDSFKITTNKTLNTVIIK